MKWIKSGFENPSKSEAIGRCGGDKKRMTIQNRQKANAKKTKTHMETFLPISQTETTMEIMYLSTQLQSFICVLV